MPEMGGSPFAGMPGMGGSPFMQSAGQRSSQSMKPETFQRELKLSLEELYTGVTKKLKVTRKRLNPNRQEDKILEVSVKPGMKAGTKFTFEREGDEEPGAPPSDIQFVIAEKEHLLYTRDASTNNLIHNAKISLADALCGTTISLKTLDGRNLSVAINEVVSPNYVKIVKNEGMPLPKEPGKRADLLIKFTIVFPSYIPNEKKSDLRRLLS